MPSAGEAASEAINRYRDRRSWVMVYVREKELYRTIGKGLNSMNVLPSFDEVKRIAATGEFNVLPVSTEILSDFITPIETMKILKNVSTHCYMLESAQASETWGR